MVRFTFNKTLGVPTFNLPAGDSCPGKSKWCQQHCYACKGHFLFPNVGECHMRNWLATQDLETFVDEAITEIQRWASEGHKRIRVHSAGDFYSVDYFRAWLEIASACPDVEFFTYTRTWRIPAFASVLPEAEQSSNFTLWFSTDPTTGVPEDAPRIAFILDGGEFYHASMPQPNCDKQTTKGADCASCGKCFHQTQTAVTFMAH